MNVRGKVESGRNENMSLTQCPNCRRRFFTDAASCPNCLQTFQPGFLQKFAVAEEKAFSAKTNALFLSLFVIWFAVLMFFQLQAYLDGSGN
jgi:hypothetical protein